MGYGEDNVWPDYWAAEAELKEFSPIWLTGQVPSPSLAPNFLGVCLMQVKDFYPLSYPGWLV